eukprot:TRINITY_DN23000_c0_g1_i1.p1 TRINITY_DN23000_c0_g1~~TRINITY_DN23000_c0_g1_i1.p1  ORF type:complete len:522 (-),score=113.84 TRINITY_DN23000_c0_g1_i1:92-1657(-)
MLLLWVALLLEALGVQGLNVLVVHPYYAGSHVLSLHSVSQKLLSRGHSVTTIKFFEDKLPPLPDHDNFTLIEMYLNNSQGELGFLERSEFAQYRLPMEELWTDGNSFWWSLKTLFQQINVMKEACRVVLHENIYEALAGTDFDVAFVDLMFNECGLALVHRLNTPAVGFGFSLTVGPQEFTTLDTLPSYVPVLLSNFGDQMNLLERTSNLVAKLSSRFYMYYVSNKVDSYIKDSLPQSPSSRELSAELNGVLVNTDFVLDYPRTYPPSFINIGGLQIKQDPGRLPGHIHKFMDGSGDAGVILFTMGFIFDPTSVPAETVSTFLSAFARLPQRVIFKYNSSEVAAAAPDNVLVLPWVPQQAILAHSKTTVFITHCGIHGVLEAIHHKVPMVGIPVFVDQGDVLRRILDKGIGVGLDKTATAYDIYEAVVEVRDNPKYKEKIKKLSSLMKMRKHSPIEDTVWFLEYVANSGGAEHLKLASRHLNIIQYYSIDSVGLILCLVATLLYLGYTAYSSTNEQKMKIN